MQKEELQKIVDNAVEIAFTALTNARVPSAGQIDLAVAHLAGTLINAATGSANFREALAERALA